MINLLPPELKVENLTERKKRVVLVNLILVLLLLVLSVFAMFSVRFYIQKQTAFLKTLAEKNEQILETEIIESMYKEINSFSIFFEKLNEFYEQKIYIFEILEKIATVLPDKIYLTSLAISPDLTSGDQSSEVKIMTGLNVYVSGFAATREEVIQLKEEMEENENFKELYFPLTNLVKPKDINFSLSFKVIKP